MSSKKKKEEENKNIHFDQKEFQAILKKRGEVFDALEENRKKREEAISERNHVLFSFVLMFVLGTFWLVFYFLFGSSIEFPARAMIGTGVLAMLLSVVGLGIAVNLGQTNERDGINVTGVLLVNSLGWLVFNLGLGLGMKVAGSMAASIFLFFGIVKMIDAIKLKMKKNTNDDEVS